MIGGGGGGGGGRSPSFFLYDNIMIFVYHKIQNVDIQLIIMK